MLYLYIFMKQSHFKNYKYVLLVLKHVSLKFKNVLLC